MPGLATASPLDFDWLRQVGETVPMWLATLRIQPGRYRFCARGLTAVGSEMALGGSCFAAKTLWMLDRWGSLDLAEQSQWIGFIQQFQTKEEGAFEDPPEMAFLHRPPPLFHRLLGLAGRAPWRPDPRSILLAETKQAIATLLEIGAEPLHPFSGFPMTPESVGRWLAVQDWSRPWGAGGQSAGLVVFIKTQAPKFLPATEVEELLAVCRRFFEGLADPVSGAYFRGTQPTHGELINGAMKVLTALAWLDVPPHYPEALVRTCMAVPPQTGGCHLVDAIYVLHQSLPEGGDAEVRAYCGRAQDLIRAHQCGDGGFSFYTRKAQTNYYGVPVSRGLPESDLQGTCLLVWALAMLQRLAAPERALWRIIKP